MTQLLVVCIAETSQGDCCYCNGAAIALSLPLYIYSVAIDAGIATAAGGTCDRHSYFY